VGAAVPHLATKPNLSMAAIMTENPVWESASLLEAEAAPTAAAEAKRASESAAAAASLRGLSCTISARREVPPLNTQHPHCRVLRGFDGGEGSLRTGIRWAMRFLDYGDVVPPPAPRPTSPLHIMPSAQNGLCCATHFATVRCTGHLVKAGRISVEEKNLRP
jgi:hypothetical protein